MHKLPVKFPAEQNLFLKNFLGTSSRVPLFCEAMVWSVSVMDYSLYKQVPISLAWSK